ncbi:MAG: hypothetical protein KF802_11855 [Bdellovibrionaceae bacterium]|nr:hypothetical protein [Pseudobdellovibrionaceae bacterium]MBX3032808.1 hypothetical protein [Pseudobdellovibrionaceae bacterium]
MKTLLMTSIVMLMPQVHASSIQTYCSNAEGTVRKANSTLENFIELTLRLKPDELGSPTQQIRDEEGVFEAEVKSSHTLSETSNSSCRQNMGSMMKKTVTLEQVVITKKDGSAFDYRIAGISQDRKTIETLMLCETVISSLWTCRKK